MSLPNVTGIVAEYNPLHTGHVYQIAKAREAACADAVVVVLSADFVQRGEPAVMSMHERAKLAVECGADLVFELPVIFSSHNAGVFANAAVKLLDATGAVNSLSFGVEQTDWDINALSDILVEEADSFKTCLKKSLQLGYSFAQARAMALEETYPNAMQILQGSNNSLALNYATELKKIGSKITLVPIKRIGSAHKDNTAVSAFASATAIRNLLKQGKFAKARDFLPANCADLIEKNLSESKLYLSSQHLWTALRTVLLRSTTEQLSACGEISEGAENKLKAEALTAKSFEEWVERCTSKRYPSGRIRRQAMQLLLGVDHWTNRAAQRLGAPYLRVLAMNQTGQTLLKKMQETAKLPIITKCGEARFSSYAESVMRYDLLASELRLGFLSSAEPFRAHAQKIYIAQ